MTEQASEVHLTAEGAMDFIAQEVLDSHVDMVESAATYNEKLMGFHRVYQRLSPEERESYGEIPSVAAVLRANNNGYGPES